MIRLSRRQRDVLSLVAEGLSNREIGDRLGVGSYTVKKHLQIASVKIGLDEGNRVLMAIWWVEHKRDYETGSSNPHVAGGI